MLAISAGTTYGQRFIASHEIPIGVKNNYSSFIDDIAGGDIDGDGKPDLVISVTFEDATRNPPYLKWFKGRGDGGFIENTIPNALNNVPQYLVLADLNGDGFLDLVTAATGRPFTGSGGVSTAAELDVYLGNGDGTFKNPQRYLQNAGVYTPVIADLNGDGKPDLAVLVSGKIQILTNQGDGTFHLGNSLAPSSPNVFSDILGAADFNSDRQSDLLIRDSTGFRVLTGKGNGTLALGPSHSLSSQFTSSTHPVQIVDVNRDGRPDVVACLLDRAEVLLGNGDGTFRGTENLQKPLRYVAGIGFTGQLGLTMAYNVASGDFNHDGNPDFAVGPSVYFGNGDGTFRISKFYSVSGLNAITLDLNNDGNPDLVWEDFSEFFGASLTTALGSAGGLFRTPFMTIARGSQAIVSGDFNRDGIMDVAVQCNDGRSLCVYPGSGKSYFNAPTAYPAVFSGGLAVGDVNGDGFLDLVATNDTSVGNSTYDVVVLLGKGDGTFGTPNTLFALNDAIGTDTYLLDINNDGKLDLVGLWGVSLGKGNGTFEAAKHLAADVEPILNVVPGDFNRDGFLDLAVPSGFDLDTPVHILLGDGSGSFPKDLPYVASNYSQGLAVADVNKDGIPDLLYGTRDPQQATGLTVAFGKGDGTFGAPATYPFVSYYCCNSNPVLLADFDRDGTIDAVVSNQGHVEYLRGLSGGKFAAGQEYLVEQNSPNRISRRDQFVILDVNRDGFPDIAVTDRDFGITRLLNSGPAVPK